MGIFGKSKKERKAEEELLKELLKRLKSSTIEDPESYEICKILELDPHNQEAMFWKGDAFERKGDYKEAILWFDKANQIKPHAYNYYRIGRAFISLKNINNAIESFKKALELDPDNFSITCRICDDFKDIGYYEEAKKCFDRYLSNHPGNSEAWAKKGEFLERIHDDEGAEECYLKADSLDPEKYRIKLKRFQRMIAREKELRKMDKNSLHLSQAEDIIGIYQCALTNQKEACLMSLNNDKLDFDNGFCVLTNYNLYLHCYGEEIIPLEKIIRVDGTYCGPFIKYGPGKDDEVVIHIKPNKDYPEFYTSLRHAMAKKRDKIENQNKGNVFINFSSIKEYLKNGGVVMQTFKCPGCGAALEFPDNVDTTTCQFCGNKIKAVDLFEKIRTLI